MSIHADAAPDDATVAELFGGSPRRLHLVGLGGTGISALAMILGELGHHISGSDQRDAPVMDRLRRLGAVAHVGHDAGHVAGADLVICSTAIKADHPERLAAAEAGIPVLSRAQALAGLTRLRPTVAVSGTHGKTTSTAMAALALRGAGADVSWLVGSDVPALGAAASWAGHDYFVVEADESDDTHLALAREAVLLTNAEGEHLDFHLTLGRVIDGYVEFMGGTPVDDPARVPRVRVAGVDDPGAALVAAACPAVTAFGSGERAAWRLDVRDRSVTGTRSVLTSPQGERIDLVVSVPGDHNALNAAGVVTLAAELGLDPRGAAEGVAHFTGTGRRFEQRGSVAGVTFVDDYAHHPTEVAATLAAATGWDGGRVVAVFQPHLYSRTQRLADRFGEALAAADVVVVTDVFAAREEPLPGVDGTIVSAAARSHGATEVHDARDRSQLAALVGEIMAPGDLVLTMGAGDITTLATELGAALDQPERRAELNSDRSDTVDGEAQ
ncbi:MAG: UDP-N-acetylmuramate--L-alanine ligase [Microthrixaceae bacterium]